MVSAESHLPFISGLDTYIIETLADVKFCEVPGSAELGNKFGDEGKRVSVLDGYSIQRTIVLGQPEWTIFLFNEEHRGCYGRFERLDLSSMQVFLQKGIQLSLFQQGQRIDFWQLRLCSRDQFDSMIPFAVLWQYVKVLPSKHRLELRNVSGQQ